MFRVSRIGRLLALAIVGLLSLIGTMAVAASAAPAGGIGVLDFTNVMKNYQGYKEATVRIQAFIEKLNAPIDIVQSGIGLSEQDFATYKKLREQPVQDKAQIDKLEAQGKANCDKFQELETKMQSGEKLNADEQALYDALKKQIYSVNGELNELQQQAQQRFNDEQRRLMDVILTAVDDAVAKVGKDQKLVMVINKNVQAGGDTVKFVYWNDKSVDVTDRVLKVLNDGFKPTMFDVAPASQPDAKPATQPAAKPDAKPNADDKK